MLQVSGSENKYNIRVTVHAVLLQFHKAMNSENKFLVVFFIRQTCSRLQSSSNVQQMERNVNIIV